MTLGTVIAVLAGGFVGAPCRWLLDRYISSKAGSNFPFGTFTINVSGSLLLGVLTGLALHGHLAGLPKVLLEVGFCGAFTTFGTFSFETISLVQEGMYLQASLNALGSAFGCLLAAIAGFALGCSI